MNMNFGNEGGPFLSGHWYNPKTGDSFTVRDTYMEDNNLIVMTTDGRRMDYNMIEQYVQTEKPMSGKISDGTSTQQPIEEIPDEVRAIMADAEAELQVQTQSRNNTQPRQTPANIYTAPVVAPAEMDEDMMLIKRLLKRASEPQIKCDIAWSNFPSEQIHMLDMMAVDDEKIAEFYLSKINIDDIRKSIADSIKKFISSKMTPKEQEEEIIIPANEVVVSADDKPLVVVEKTTTKKQVVKKTSEKKPSKQKVKKDTKTETK